MGCNSSAPNIITPMATPIPIDELAPAEEVEIKKRLSHAAEAVNFSDDTNQIKVLPTCDNLKDSIQLAVDNSCCDVDHAPVNAPDKGDNVKVNNNHANVENKLATMVEVVDKVVKLHKTPEKDVEGEMDDTAQTRNKTKQSSTNDINIEDAKMETIANYKINDESPSVNVAPADEQKSPEKSEDKIVTRWEALADIAAELPPLLAIDPVTGQIYSLSK